MFEVRRVDLTTGAISEPVPSDAEVIAVVGGRQVCLAWIRGPEDFDSDNEDEPFRSGRMVRIVDTIGPASSEAPIPDVDGESVAVDGSVVWFQADERPALVAIDIEHGAVREVVVDVDCSEFVPAAMVPDDLDPLAFEASQLDGLRGALFEGWRAESGEQHPFIAGVDFDSVEITGSFPRTEVVALFHASDRPDIQFGRRWSLYDDLGNPQPLEYADIHLMEDIEAAGHGLPPIEACLPDDDGIVWF